MVRYQQSRLVAVLAIGLFLSSTAPVCVAETLLTRPATETLPAAGRTHDLGVEWEKLRKGQLEFAAMLLETYPEHEIYFLERDARKPGLMTHLIATPAEQKRLHFLNVNRTTKDDPLLDRYLEQEGISEAALKSGKKILFVDTGFVGSIPAHIKSRLPSKYSDQIQTQMMATAPPDDFDTEHPSSRAFATAVDPKHVGEKSINGDPVLALAKVPKSIGRADKFVESNGLIVPAISGNPATRDNDDGKISAAREAKHLEDLKAATEGTLAKLWIDTRREIWRKARELHLAGDKAKLVDYLKSLMAHGEPEKEAIVRDFIELTRTNLPSPKYVLFAQDVGLKPTEMGLNVKAYLSVLYPALAPYLKNGSQGLEDLVDSKNVKQVLALVSVIDRHKDELRVAPILEDLIKALAQKSVEPFAQEMLVTLAEELPPKQLAKFAQFALSGKPHEKSAELSKILTERVPLSELSMVIESWFKNPENPRSPETETAMLRKAVRYQVVRALGEFAYHALRTPPYRDDAELIRRLLDQGRTGKHDIVFRGVLEAMSAGPVTKVRADAATEAIRWMLAGEILGGTQAYLPDAVARLLAQPGAKENLSPAIFTEIRRWAKKHRLKELRQQIDAVMPPQGWCVFGLFTIGGGR